MSTEATLDALAAAMNKAIMGERGKVKRRFTLNEPHKVTTKTRAGVYQVRPLIGGEEFEPVSCYKGKKGQLIFVFKPVTPTDYQFMEMNAEEGRKYLDKFSQAVDSWMNGKFDEDIERIQEEVKLRESMAVVSTMAERYKDNPEFATW